MLQYANSIGIGFVTAVYPQGQSVDVLMSDDGSRLSNVQVMVPTGSSNTGMVDLPDPGLPSDNTRWEFNTQPERFLRAVIAFSRSAPVCIGFLMPQVTQMTFKQKNRRIVRHASDVYTTIDDAGNTELYHPSGVYFRIGTNPAHEDLTGQDVDKAWKIARNTGQAVHVHLAALNGTTFDVDPTGNVTVNVPHGTVGLTCPAGVTVTAPTHFIGNMVVDGTVDINGDVTIVGNTGITGNLGVNGTVTFNGAAVDITATINLTGSMASSGDIVAGTISLMTHPHFHGTYTAGATAVTGLSGLPT
jgi:hypothetical protein